MPTATETKAGPRWAWPALGLSIAAALVPTVLPLDIGSSGVRWAGWLPLDRVGARLHDIEWQLVYVDPRGRWIVDTDLVQNLALFAPAGLCWAFVRRGRPPWRTFVEALVLGATLSALIEAAQLLLPDRVPQLADVWRNAAGCALGAVVTSIVERARALRRRRA